LTVEKDKLPALAGLAQKVQKETKQTYVAGLWFETLAWDLLWNARDMMYPYAKPRQGKALLDLAPSWSWASVGSTIEMPVLQEDYPITDITEHAFILGVEGLPSGKAAFGRAGRVALNIECEVLIPVTPLHPDDHPERNQFQYRYIRSHDTEPFIFWSEFDHHDVNQYGMKYLLPLHTRIESKFVENFSYGYEPPSPKNSQIIIRGLIFEQTGRGEYKRIGTFRPDFTGHKQPQHWVELTKIFIPDLKETDRLKRDMFMKTLVTKDVLYKSYRYEMSTLVLHSTAGDSRC
jgi:hypothetical protein